MASSFLIGLGGTGAKVIESFIYLAACGLAPKSVQVVLIDQDRANGNLTRTRNLLNRYQALFKPLRLDPSDLGNSRLLACRLETRESPLWHAITESPDLDGLFGADSMTPPLARLYQCLYDSEERRAPLDVGFRGRPSVGAAAFLARFTESHRGFMEDGLANPLADLSLGEDVQVFLAGSIFGGTGAAGLPVVARLVRNQYVKSAGTGRLALGAAMMLPYFAFSTDSQHENNNGTVAGATTLLERAQQALRYYGFMLRPRATTSDNGLFDGLYYVGWRPLIRLDYFRAGKKEQENPSLVPELLAALAAAHFFRQPASGSFLLGREERAAPAAAAATTADSKPVNQAPPIITWEDVPQVMEGKESTAEGVRNSLGSLVRFAYAYHYLYAPYLTRKEGFRKVRLEWWRRELLPAEDFSLDSEGTRGLMDDMDEFCRGVLGWAAAVSFFSGPNTSFYPPILFRADGYAVRPEAAGMGQPELKGLADLDPGRFGDLELPEPSTSLAEVFKALHDGGNQPKDATRLGRFLGALYASAKL